MSEIADNLTRVRERIASACARAGRSVSDVRLVAVSKTKPISLVQEALAAGQKIFGENYVQEAVDKINQLPTAEWHFIGSLQSNKARMIAGEFALIHSVDRVKIATALNDALNSKLQLKNTDSNSDSNSKLQPVLLQLRIGDESTKHGFTLAELPAALTEIKNLSNLDVRGLMALPPLEDDESKSRSHFASVREALSLVQRHFPNAHELSMGTSGDLEAAILEGATLVRVGTDIFGARG